MASNRKLNIILLGESGVGKTSLCSRFVKNAFSTKYKSTVVLDLFPKKMDLEGTEVSLQLWATAGRDCYRALLLEYYRLADGCLLVYDVNLATTFDKLHDWLSEFQAVNEKAPVIIVGNKSDDATSEAANQSLISSFSSQEYFQFMNCSAKTGENVYKVFESLIQNIWKNNQVEKLVENNEENASTKQYSEENDESTEPEMKDSVELREENSSILQTREENTSPIYDISTRDNIFDEKNFIMNQNSERNTPYIQRFDKCGKFDEIRLKNHSPKTFIFVDVVTLGSKKIRKLPILKLN